MLKVEIKLTGEIDSSVFPADALPAARENVGGLLRALLQSPLREKVNVLADRGLSKAEQEFAVMQLNADIALAESLLEGFEMTLTVTEASREDPT